MKPPVIVVDSMRPVPPSDVVMEEPGDEPVEMNEAVAEEVEKVKEVPEVTAPIFNSEQLEECDESELGEETYAYWMDGEEHRVTQIVSRLNKVMVSQKI